MRHRRFGVIFCLCLLMGCRVASSSSTELDRSTPDAVIHAFYQSMNEADPDLMGTVCAVDSTAEQAAREAMENLLAAGFRYTVTDIQWYVIADNGDELRVKTLYDGVTRVGDTIAEEGPSGDWLTLVRIQGSWYVKCLEP